MDKEKFKNIMCEYLVELNIELSDTQLEQFYNYMELLLEWNKVINLTAITDPEEIIKKHFIDSLTIIKRLKETSSIIDVGSGAGFPGIPIKIFFPRTNVILLDSLNKRIKFLNEVIEKLNLKGIKAVHGRAEDFGRNKEYREKFDVATARAVAPLQVLIEYLMPFVKVGGSCLCMKGSNSEEEIKNSENAINMLGGNLIKTEEFIIPKTDIKRRVVEIKKIKETEKKYPRKAGVPSKTPL